MRIKECEIVLMSLLMCGIFSGCTNVADHAGTTHGYLTVGMNQHFGDGGEKKDYYTLDEMTLIVPGDLKPSVREKLGLPDEVKSNNEGYEIWIYKDRNIELFFEDEKFREWAYLK